jgi:signal transduction histidine kinase
MSDSRGHTVSFAAASYALASAFVVAALGISVLLGRILPFTFFLAAVMLAAWFRGAAVGVFALFLSLAAIDYFVEPPLYSIKLTAAYAPRLVTFALSALLVIWMSAARRRAERALRAARDELDERVRERTASLARTNERLLAEMDERRRATARLIRAKRRSRERVLEARFGAVLEERTRLAREIHDTLLQGFTGVSLHLVATMSRWSGPPEVVGSLREVLSLAQKTLADARQAVWDMRPPALGDDDFSAALRASLDRTLAGAALASDYVVRGVPHALLPEVETVVYRVAQEAVSNVMKHATARTVRITLSYDSRSVRLAVADDGRGFIVPPDLHAYTGHWGLLGMRERASQLRGRLTVRSAPGEGTRVLLRVPSRPALAVQVESSLHAPIAR